MDTVCFSLETEYRLLGGAIKSFDWACNLFQHLKPIHFYSPKSRLVFATLEKLAENEREITLETVSAHIPPEVKPDDLIEIYGLGSLGLFFEDLCAQLLDLYKRRELQSSATQLVQSLDSQKNSYQEIVLAFETSLYASADSESKKYTKKVSEIWEPENFLKILQQRQQDRLDGKSVFAGIPTHYYDLDKLISGLVPGHFTIVGARPGVGKTTFGLNLLDSLLFKSKVACHFFSLEMPAKEIGEKLIAQRASIPYDKIKTGNLTGEEFACRIVPVFKSLESAPLTIDDTPSISIEQLKSRALRLKRTSNIKVILIDYIQLVRSKGHEARHLEIADISRRCKEIAKELDVCVVALAQLNREVEKREDKRPYVSDLRESGSLEADADEILLLHRPEMYDAHHKPGLIEVNVAKNRFGPTGQVHLTYNRQTGEMNSYAKIYGSDFN